MTRHSTMDGLTGFSDADKRRMIYIYTAYKNGWTIRRGATDAEVIITKPPAPSPDVLLYFMDFIDIQMELAKVGGGI